MQSQSNKQQWFNQLDSISINRIEMNKIIMDYLIHEGFKEAAEKFKEEAGIDMEHLEQEDCPAAGEDPELLDRRVQIKTRLEDGEILSGEALINKYYPEIFANHKDIYFKLQLQHLKELIRKQKINEVLDYVSNLVNVESEAQISELERTMVLLAFDKPDTSPYGDLLQISHRQKLASEINNIILKIQRNGSITTPKPRLVTLIKLLLWTQNELLRKQIHLPKIIDLAEGTIS